VFGVCLCFFCWAVRLHVRIAAGASTLLWRFVPGNNVLGSPEAYPLCGSGFLLNTLHLYGL
jgi:hypothetical protein